MTIAIYSECGEKNLCDLCGSFDALLRRETEKTADEARQMGQPTSKRGRNRAEDVLHWRLVTGAENAAVRQDHAKNRTAYRIEGACR